MITANHYVMLSLVLLALGVVGVMMRRNFITVLMSLELIFNAVNLNLGAFSYRLGDLAGEVAQSLREGDQVEVDGVEQQLERHQHGDEVAPHHDSDEAEAEQDHTSDYDCGGRL